MNTNTSERPRYSRWRYIGSPIGTLRDVAINRDGTLHNPHGYPEDVVRAAIAKASAEHVVRQHERRSNGAKKAAVTRARRQERKTHQIAQRYVAGAKIGPRSSCVICSRGLSDPMSIERGIGSECWQGFLLVCEQYRVVSTPETEHRPNA